jgi:hypothetical protein
MESLCFMTMDPLHLDILSNMTHNNDLFLLNSKYFIENINYYRKHNMLGDTSNFCIFCKMKKKLIYEDIKKSIRNVDIYTNIIVFLLRYKIPIEVSAKLVKFLGPCPF